MDYSVSFQLTKNKPFSVQFEWIPTGCMNSKLAVAVYAAEHVKIEGNINIKAANATTHCNPHLERLRDLDNVEDIKNGEDSKFPPVLASIGGGLLGDAAQNVAEKAETYNTWKRFTEFY